MLGSSKFINQKMSRLDGLSLVVAGKKIEQVLGENWFYYNSPLWAQ